MLAKRCCGREAILMDVRRAEDDIAFSKEGMPTTEEVLRGELALAKRIATVTWRRLSAVLCGAQEAGCRGTWGSVAEV
jgi:hypothetical protein